MATDNLLPTTWGEVWAVPHSHAPMGVSKEEWTVRRFSHTTFVGVILERTPGFIRQKHPLTGKDGDVLVMHLDMLGKEFIFANCLACRSKKFDDKNMPFPLAVSITNDDLPRLGKCGCVCCNECVRRVIPEDVHDQNNPYHGFIPCPYCKFQHGHSLDTIAWVFTGSMLGNCPANMPLG
jgi:hypothetical protein